MWLDKNESFFGNKSLTIYQIKKIYEEILLKSTQHSSLNEKVSLKNNWVYKNSRI